VTDGGILPNDRAGLREASPTLSRALDAAVGGYDRARQAAGGEPLSERQKATFRPMIAAAVEAYLGVVGGGAA
jgi:hypothetical protein